MVGCLATVVCVLIGKIKINTFISPTMGKLHDVGCGISTLGILINCETHCATDKTADRGTDTLNMYRH